MMREHTCIGIAIILVMTMLFAGCENSGTRESLQRADMALDTVPEYAMTIIQSIDTSRLSSPRMRADYALIKTMALLKTDRKLVSKSMLAPAYDYYGKSSKPSRQAMLTHFAKGMTSDSCLQALDEYQEAIRLCPENGMTDYLVKCHINRAALYNNNDEHNGARKEIDAALRILDKHDCPRLKTAALYYSGMTHMAFGNYQEAIAELKRVCDDPSLHADPSFRDMSEIGLAYLYSLSSKDLEAIEIFEKVLSTGTLTLSAKEILAYVRSLANTGQVGKAYGILDSLQLPDDIVSKADMCHTRAHLAALDGDFRTAYSMSVETNNANNLILKNRMANAIHAKEKENISLEKENALLWLENEKFKNGILILGLILSALSLALVIIMLHKVLTKSRRIAKNAEKAMLEAECERKRLKDDNDTLSEKNKELGSTLAMIKDELEKKQQLNTILEKRQSHLRQQVESMRQDKSISQEKMQMITEELDRTVSEKEELKGNIAAFEENLLRLRNMASDNFRRFHSRNAIICNNSFKSHTSEDVKSKLEQQKNVIVQYYSNKPTLTAIEEDIDTCMDNLISRVRASARLNSDEIAFIIYDICGFDYKSIALLLNISANSSATRKSRIKLKLTGLASESGLSGLDNIPLTL